MGQTSRTAANHRTRIGHIGTRIEDRLHGSSSPQWQPPIQNIPVVTPGEMLCIVLGAVILLPVVTFPAAGTSTQTDIMLAALNLFATMMSQLALQYVLSNLSRCKHIFRMMIMMPAAPSL